MTRAIDRLKSRVGPGSIVLLYFGGYGVQSDGQNYMIPVDAKIWGERDVRRDGVSVDRLLSDLKDSGARIRLAVMTLRGAIPMSDASGATRTGLRLFKQRQTRSS
jgi:uncharacterized caspase-like protein